MLKLSPPEEINNGTSGQHGSVGRDWNLRGRINDAPLYIDDSPNMTLVEIRAKCRRLKQLEGLKMVVIDYLPLLTSGKI